MRFRAADRKRLAALAFGVLLVVLLAAAGIGAGRSPAPGLPLTGLPPGPVGAAALKDLAIRVDARGHDPHAVELAVDGAAVTGRVEGDSVVYHPEGLADGEHTFTAEIPRGAPIGWVRGGPAATATFTVDTAAPELEVAQPDTVASYRDPVTVRGRAPDAARVSIGAETVTPGPDGSFETELSHHPSGSEVVAVDAAGNATSRALTTGIDLPRMRAVHVTAYAWSDDGMRESVLDMARQGRIDTVQLDIKDEDGMVGYDSKVPLARTTGAATPIYEARAALRQLHEMGVQVVGRIVAFRDPALAGWAWHHGRPDWVVQDPSGQPYSSHYGAIAFTNFAHAEVRAYNIALAVEAAELGFDGIMYDYVRRPDGSLSSMRFPGLTGPATAGVAGFLKQSREPVHSAGAHLSAAVYGIAASRPDQIAQDISLIAKQVDFVAPMIYPSHWNTGEYGVADPNNQPYDIVAAALRDFQTVTKGTGAKVIPWLQDFSLGADYGDAQVRAQIDATNRAGIDSFFLWSPSVSYHAGALAPK
ncbi:putative glycoside hydrolase [Nocardia sp. NBC_00416]|uniref:putative glycoside hydrolase n=1 Tax=Nocardia sp. NBC_00416 TaxID=2975991 RepID=UPI002E1EEE36